MAVYRSNADEESILRELDALRVVSNAGRHMNFTALQERVLREARSGETIVPWKVLAKWWTERGWPGNLSTLQRHLKKLKEQNQES